MRCSSTVEFLYSLQMFGARFGLETTHRLAALLGNPHQGLQFIHVAGTNGKGSTCAMLESIYRHAGLRVGLFTSPHLVSFAERIQVNRNLIPESDVARLVAEVQPLLAQFPPKSHPTFFEVVTVMALRYFAEQRCDLVIWEAGLGGRLDATNIVTPLASVITNIDFDHQQWLGDTLDKIAAEKAGIIKPGVPVITAAEPGRGLEVIAESARRLESPLTVAKRQDATSGFAATLAMPLLGEHQRLNAAIALATVRTLAGKIPVSEAAQREGLSRVSWPGRMQLAKSAKGQTVLLDGAHNAASAAALREAFQKQFAHTRPTLVLGLLADKDWKAIASTLAPLAGHILLVPVSSRRTLAPERLRSVCQDSNSAAATEVCASLAEALEKSANESFLLITGSLYLVGEAIERLHLSPAPRYDERGLNEWGSVVPESRNL
jgi:dihydrofolate synthase/folylpolyglutamate synthase